jgi:hypothetical protein
MEPIHTITPLHLLLLVRRPHRSIHVSGPKQSLLVFRQQPDLRAVLRGLRTTERCMSVGGVDRCFWLFLVQRIVVGF